MEKTVQELKTLIRELILEVGDLRERIDKLEGELCSHQEDRPRDKSEVIKLLGEGYGQLGKIYNEGYHVCPAAYGEPRSEECLFCIVFMEKE